MTAGFNRVLLATLILTASTIQTGWANSFITLVNNPFNEKLFPAPKISSAGRGMVVGVDVKNSVTDSPLSVLASFPNDWKNLAVCLSVLSADGLYVAQNTYSVSGDAKSFAEFPFNTNFRERLQRIDPQDIAVSVSLGNCGTDQPEIFFVGAWGTGVSNMKPTLRVLVYSQQASEVYLYDDTGQTETKCTQWHEKTVYDFVCYWQPDLSKPNVRQMEVLTVRNGETEATDEFSIQFGAGF